MAEEVQVVLHHGTVLPCEAQGFPRPSISWQREGVPIATGNDTLILIGVVHIRTEDVCSVKFTQQQLHPQPHHPHHHHPSCLDSSL